MKNLKLYAFIAALISNPLQAMRPIESDDSDGYETAPEEPEELSDDNGARAARRVQENGNGTGNGDGRRFLTPTPRSVTPTINRPMIDPTTQIIKPTTTVVTSVDTTGMPPRAQMEINNLQKILAEFDIPDMINGKNSRNLDIIQASKALRSMNGRIEQVRLLLQNRTIPQADATKVEDLLVTAEGMAQKVEGVLKERVDSVSLIRATFNRYMNEGATFSQLPVENQVNKLLNLLDTLKISYAQHPDDVRAVVRLISKALAPRIKTMLQTIRTLTSKNQLNKLNTSLAALNDYLEPVNYDANYKEMLTQEGIYPDQKTLTSWQELYTKDMRAASGKPAPAVDTTGQQNTFVITDGMTSNAQSAVSIGGKIKDLVSSINQLSGVDSADQPLQELLTSVNQIVVKINESLKVIKNPKKSANSRENAIQTMMKNQQTLLTFMGRLNDKLEQMTPKKDASGQEETQTQPELYSSLKILKNATAQFNKALTSYTESSPRLIHIVWSRTMREKVTALAKALSTLSAKKLLPGQTGALTDRTVDPAGVIDAALGVVKNINKMAAEAKRMGNTEDFESMVYGEELRIPTLLTDALNALPRVAINAKSAEVSQLVGACEPVIKIFQDEIQKVNADTGATKTDKENVQKITTNLTELNTALSNVKLDLVILKNVDNLQTDIDALKDINLGPQAKAGIRRLWENFKALVRQKIGKSSQAAAVKTFVTQSNALAKALVAKCQQAIERLAQDEQVTATDKNIISSYAQALKIQRDILIKMGKNAKDDKYINGAYALGHNLETASQQALVVLDKAISDILPALTKTLGIKEVVEKFPDVTLAKVRSLVADMYSGKVRANTPGVHPRFFISPEDQDFLDALSQDSNLFFEQLKKAGTYDNDVNTLELQLNAINSERAKALVRQALEIRTQQDVDTFMGSFNRAYSDAQTQEAQQLESVQKMASLLSMAKTLQFRNYPADVKEYFDKQLSEQIENMKKSLQDKIEEQGYALIQKQSAISWVQFLKDGTQFNGQHIDINSQATIATFARAIGLAQPGADDEIAAQAFVEKASTNPDQLLTMVDNLPFVKSGSAPSTEDEQIVRDVVTILKSRENLGQVNKQSLALLSNIAQGENVDDAIKVTYAQYEKLDEIHNALANTSNMITQALNR